MFPEDNQTFKKTDKENLSNLPPYHRGSGQDIPSELRQLTGVYYSTN